MNFNFTKHFLSFFVRDDHSVIELSTMEYFSIQNNEKWWEMIDYRALTLLFFSFEKQQRYLADLNEVAKIPQLCDRSICFNQVIDELIIRLTNIIIKSDYMKYYLPVCKTKFWLSYWRSIWISNTCFFAQMYARFFTHTGLNNLSTVEFCDGPRRLGISVISLITTITCPLRVFLCFAVEYKFFNGSLTFITQTRLSDSS